jgi:hypothetical protein
MLKEATKVMKLTNVLGRASRPFAGVLLALSLLGFFPLYAKQRHQDHRINLIKSERVKSQEPADDGSRYEWWY